MDNHLSGGDTTVEASVPEPSTLAMFGIGTFALAGTLRRKPAAQRVRWASLLQV